MTHRVQFIIVPKITNSKEFLNFPDILPPLDRLQTQLLHYKTKQLRYPTVKWPNYLSSEIPMRRATPSGKVPTYTQRRTCHLVVNFPRTLLII